MEFTHIVSLGGESHLVNPDTYQEVCDRLFQKYKAVPQVTPISEASKDTPIPVTAIRIDNVPNGQSLAVPQGPIMSNGINLTGLARATADEEAAVKAGFAMKQPHYALGMGVNSTGVANANRSRIEHNLKPFVAEYCDDFKLQVKAEDRKDILLPRKDIRLTNSGRLAIGEERFWLNPSAFDSMVARMNIGGSGYLADNCWPELRAININQQAKRLGVLEDAARENFRKNPPKRGRGYAKKFNDNIFNIRTRVNPNHDVREVFGVVTDSYTVFDVDKVAEALKIAAPSDARGSVAYDGERARFEVLWSSNVEGSEFVAGEVFKAGVIIKTADDGSGGLNVWAVVWRNLCLNLIIIDECMVPTARIRHIGSIDKLVEKFHEGFKNALERVEHFRKAWGYSVNEDVVARSQTRTDEEIPVNIQDALPGFYFAMLKQDLITIPGMRKKDAVVELVRSYEKDPANNPNMITRSALVNSITRLAHEGNFADPFLEDELQIQAGALLFGKKNREPEPIPYEPISSEEIED